MKKIIFVFSILCLVLVAFATQMIVHTTSGDESFELDEITNITFGTSDYVYFEDFDIDPNFTLMYTPQTGEYFEWDATEEIYKIRILEEDGGIEKFVYTPEFQNIENQSFSIGVDIKGLEESWGMSLGMTFIDDNYIDGNNSMHIYYNGTNDLFSFSDETNSYNTGDNSINLNIWYHISLNYNSSTNTVDILVTERDSGNLIYEVGNASFFPSQFNKIALGHRTNFWDGSTAANHYDNIQISLSE